MSNLMFWSMKTYEEFKSECRKNLGRSLGRLLRVTFYETGVSHEAFCERAGIRLSNLYRIMNGKASPRFELVCWLEYVCECYFVESEKKFLLPLGPIDAMLSL